LYKQAAGNRTEGCGDAIGSRADYGLVIWPERAVFTAKRGASTHPGILQRRHANSYLWDASRGFSPQAARRRQ
jgi:hypothetical protein